MLPIQRPATSVQQLQPFLRLFWLSSNKCDGTVCDIIVGYLLYGKIYCVWSADCDLVLSSLHSHHAVGAKMLLFYTPLYTITFRGKSCIHCRDKFARDLGPWHARWYEQISVRICRFVTSDARHRRTEKRS